MIVGNPNNLAIESEIYQAYPDLGLRALGFFLIHLGGVTFGVRARDATLLACSFDQVAARMRARGKHVASFANNPDPAMIAEAVTAAVYGPTEQGWSRLGCSHEDLRTLVYSNELIWAPDGDEAFDDGSSVIQMDAGSRVRLIGFKRQDYRYMPATLRDVWMEADVFYDILGAWHDGFAAEWALASKIPAR